MGEVGGAYVVPKDKRCRCVVPVKVSGICMRTCWGRQMCLRCKKHVAWGVK
jgi:hypothetical protein